MIVSIMQPYFFPYIGYFQLIFHSDVFVFLDDVQYIKGGWINRNRILHDGGPRWLTRPVRKAAYHLAINQRYYQPGAARVLRRVEAAYGNAPHFAKVFPVVADLLSFPDANVAAFNINLLTRISALLAIRRRFIVSSAMVKDESLTGPRRVVDMCHRLGATHYVNPIGGAHLYRPPHFAAAGVTLSFLQPTVPNYPQFGQEPVRDLSIIDALMFNGDGAVVRLLRKYRLEP
jgi:WbqC-like protein family